MADKRLRQRIAVDAARLMVMGEVKEYFTAKRKAARRYGLNYRYSPKSLPSNREIRDEILTHARIHEGDARTVRLGDMRRCAYAIMQAMKRFRPKLIGSVCTGHIRQGSDVDIHVFADSLDAVTAVLREQHLRFATERKVIVKHGDRKTYTHVHVEAEFEVELTVYPSARASYPFKSSITGRRIESATIDQLCALIRREHPEVDLEDAGIGPTIRGPVYGMLLGALEGVMGGPHHPEGDQLYHSLQVFELARTEVPYDVELAEAALLHDIGKAIDPGDHAAAGAEALDGLCSGRVRYLVEHHMEIHKLRAGTLGRRKASRLRASPWFDDLVALRSFDDRGRRCGVWVPELDEALDYLDPQTL